ncbi:hydrogenase expression/formation protein HypE [candidate division WOR_3 bacterium SM1_77]|jgi:hydrogenase expression/formation protein HypE|uniref:Hydrogenase expression/formation protein HypE n=1 Tax=candidate division WOR_3 bacterium SM1_77 TaxID=1703778 RepID=A0A0S8JXW5_UNCW3|nr:MAG: hydrogenase expression/formation protein HypE [candidate division WOR_3 bacterium SM1_77]
MKQNKIRLGHGSGGLLMSQLIKEVILKHFDNKILRRLEDAAELPTPNEKVAFTTDSYVVDPIFFPGGDIGKLAICGTINDLVMKGAIPKYLSFSLIIEEGFALLDLEKILKSAARTARKAGVSVVCGDTKVVEKGKADKIFITTSGVGIIKQHLGKDRIRTGDRIMISGTIGDHGVAIMNERLKLGLESSVKSDVAPLNAIVAKILGTGQGVHFMRDPTRGGVVSALNEAIDNTGFGIVIDESRLPIKRQVRGASEILGLDPMYIANEGKFVAIVAKKDATRVLYITKTHPLGKHAALVGKVVREPQGVWLKTRIGGTHPLLQLEAEGLPRIC